MSIQALIARTRRHWEKWLPKKAKQLKATHQCEIATQDAATNAQQEIVGLMADGFQEHEAEEVALPKYILPQPEERAVDTPRQRRELASLDRAYRESPQA